jgi:hypothetical protein
MWRHLGDGWVAGGGVDLEFGCWSGLPAWVSDEDGNDPVAEFNAGRVSKGLLHAAARFAPRIVGAMRVRCAIRSSM